MSESPLCQKCRAPMLPILFGMPTHEAFEASERGEVILGGCCVTGNDPDWQCPTCGATLPENAEALQP